MRNLYRPGGAVRGSLRAAAGLAIPRRGASGEGSRSFLVPAGDTAIAVCLARELLNVEEARHSHPVGAGGANSDCGGHLRFWGPEARPRAARDRFWSARAARREGPACSANELQCGCRRARLAIFRPPDNGRRSRGTGAVNFVERECDGAGSAECRHATKKRACERPPLPNWRGWDDPVSGARRGRVEGQDGGFRRARIGNGSTRRSSGHRSAGSYGVRELTLPPSARFGSSSMISMRRFFCRLSGVALDATG